MTLNCNYHIVKKVGLNELQKVTFRLFKRVSTILEKSFARKIKVVARTLQAKFWEWSYKAPDVNLP